MATINELTEDQFKLLLDDYFAPPLKRSKMSEQEIKDLAERLNKKINVPLIRETKEEKILIKIVIKIDRVLYETLPNELYDLVRSLDRGIDDDEAKRLIKRLSRLANKHIDIPYIPEALEYVAIRFVIAIIIKSARKEFDFDKAKEEMTNMNIPEGQEATDEQLDSLVVPVR